MLSSYVSRVNQIDAIQLDEEIYKVFKNQVKDIFKYCPPGRVDKWQPEIEALLRIFIWSFSLRNQSSTFGQKMLNLYYGKMNKQKAILYLVFMLFPKYFHDRFIENGTVFRYKYGDKLKQHIESIFKMIQLLDLVTLMVFLHRGIQPQLIEVLLGISSESLSKHRPRGIGYSYMTRELLWHGLMELFTTVIPLVNYHYIIQKFKYFWIRRKNNGVKRTYPLLNATTKCAYCDEKPILPVHAGCEHIFCYYCLQANFTVTKVFTCPQCDVELYASNIKNYIVTPSS